MNEWKKWKLHFLITVLRFSEFNCHFTKFLFNLRRKLFFEPMSTKHTVDRADFLFIKLSLFKPVEVARNGVLDIYLFFFIFFYRHKKLHFLFCHFVGGFVSEIETELINNG